MKLAFVLALASCDPPAMTQTPPPVASQTPTQTQTPAQNIDVRVDFEKTSDQYSSYIAAFLTIPAMNVHVQLFAVPFPYGCMRRETDASDALAFQCLGDDSGGFASVRIDGGHVIATARDYGHIGPEKIMKDLALPPNTTATIFSPPNFPSEH